MKKMRMITDKIKLIYESKRNIKQLDLGRNNNFDLYDAEEFASYFTGSQIVDF